MRISTTLIQFRAINAMLDQSNDLARTQLELATGLRILTPADDPIGATTIMPLKDFVSQHEQFGKNSDVAETRLQMEDAALDSFTDILIRVNELAVQGNNDTLNNSDRDAIATELRENLSSLVALANTRDGNGEYIFAGDKVNTVPIVETVVAGIYTYTYDGDNGQRNLQVGANRQVAVGDTGFATFMDIPFSGGPNQSVFATINEFIVKMQANVSDTIVLQDIQTAIDTILSTRAKVGARLNTIDTQRDLNESFILQSKQTISNIEDLDFTEAISRMNQQLVSLQASQQTYIRIQNLSLFNYL